MPTTRIVFDEFVPAATYVTAVHEIRPVSYIMGEILDSFYVKDYTVAAYRQRTIEYLDTFGTQIDLWEIGNEINGEWLSKTKDVIDKMTAAYDAVKARGFRTELTLYYNQDCWEKKQNEMFTWAESNIPETMKQGLDYVLVSYYEDDCNGLRPDWLSVFSRLALMFPNSKIGFGEVGTQRPDAKVDFINRYYTLKIPLANYVGGYFWWYYREDMVPMNALWSVLSQAMTRF
jgi:hypothetical protein